MFEHVIDERLRSILTRHSTEPDDLTYAMMVTANAVAADDEDDDLPGKAMEYRHAALSAAEEAWKEEAWQSVIALLRDVWSV